MNNPKQYLFLFTIGPVQSFIEQARKARDLFAGSHLLSALIKEGMKEFDFEKEIIFPKSQSDSLPNRFIAHFSGTADEAKEKGKEIESVVRKYWAEIAWKTLTSLPKNIHENSKLQTAYEQQITQHLDIHWAFQEIKDDNYQEAYSDLEALVGSIKNVRPFEQFSYNGIGEQGRKCSLDGERNALFFGNGTNERYHGKKSKWNPDAKVLPKNDVRIDANEGLSAVSFVKRLYNEADHFPSTAKVALVKDEAEVCEKGDDFAKVALTSYKGFFNNGDFDYQLYYEENLTDKYFDKHGLEGYKDKLPNMRKTLKQFKKYLKQKYYALVVFDGDKMGEWLGGKHLEEGKSLKDFHGEFSKLLAAFAQKANELVNLESHQNGQTIYAGGDDYMGLVNLECLFEVMESLSQEFDQIISQPLHNTGLIKNDAKLTFSAGIVVAHYKHPLSEVLKKARAIEKVAKKDGDRNAFTLSVMKGSGEIQQTTYGWGANLQNWKALKYIVDCLVAEKVSNKFITNLSRELYQLAGVELAGIDADFLEIEDAVFVEVERLIKRAKGTTNDNLDKEVVLQEHVKLLWKNSPDTLKQTTQNFIHALHIADFIHRQTSK